MMEKNFIEENFDVNLKISIDKNKFVENEENKEFITKDEKKSNQLNDKGNLEIKEELNEELDEEFEDVKEQCEDHVNFAVICSFFQQFGTQIGVNYSIETLKYMLESEKIDDNLIDLHVKLLRKIKKYVNKDRWENGLIKFLYEYSQVGAWELERFGYKGINLKLKIDILKRLLESQFDGNQKFKVEINNIESLLLRLVPIGRDLNGNQYWYYLDEEYTLRIYREQPDEEKSWKLICQDKDEFTKLIEDVENGKTEKYLPIQIIENGDLIDNLNLAQTDQNKIVKKSNDKQSKVGEIKIKNLKKENLNEFVKSDESKTFIKNKIDIKKENIDDEKLESNELIKEKNFETKLFKKEFKEEQNEIIENNICLDENVNKFSNEIFVEKTFDQDLKESNIFKKDEANKTEENQKNINLDFKTSTNYVNKESETIEIEKDLKFTLIKSEEDDIIKCLLYDLIDKVTNLEVNKSLKDFKEITDKHDQKADNLFQLNSEFNNENILNSEENNVKKVSKRGRKKGSKTNELSKLLESNAINDIIDSATPVKRSSRIQKLKEKKSAELKLQMELEQKRFEDLSKSKKSKKKEIIVDKYESEDNEESDDEKDEDFNILLKDKKKNVSSDSDFELSKSSKKKKARNQKKKKDKKLKKNKTWSSNEEEEELFYLEEEEEELHFDDNNDEFACEELDEDEEPVILKRARTARKVKNEDEENEINEVINDDTPCQKCNLYNSPEWILLCDNCDLGYHTDCLIPKLYLIPDGNWYCPQCENQQLLTKLKFEFENYIQNLEKRGREQLRKERLKYVAINIGNILQEDATSRQRKNLNRRPYNVSEFDYDDELSNDDDDENDNEFDDDNEDSPKRKKNKKLSKYDRKSSYKNSFKNRNRRRSFSDESQGSKDSSNSDDDLSDSVSESDDSLPKQRTARKRVSYQFKEYDELINSAIQVSDYEYYDEEEEDINEEVSSEDDGKSPYSKGKDISNLINMAGEDLFNSDEKNKDQNKDQNQLETKLENYEKSNTEEKNVKGDKNLSKNNKKNKGKRKLNDLDSPDDDPDEDSDFAINEDSNTELEEDEENLDFSAEDTEEEEDNTDSSDWGKNKRKTRNRNGGSKKYKKKSKKNKKRRRYDSEDDDFEDSNDDSDYGYKTRKKSKRVSYKELSSTEEDEDDYSDNSLKFSKNKKTSKKKYESSDFSEEDLTEDEKVVVRKKKIKRKLYSDESDSFSSDSEQENNKRKSKREIKRKKDEDFTDIEESDKEFNEESEKEDIEDSDKEDNEDNEEDEENENVGNIENKKIDEIPFNNDKKDDLDEKIKIKQFVEKSQNLINSNEKNNLEILDKTSEIVLPLNNIEQVNSIKKENILIDSDIKNLDSNNKKAPKVKIKLVKLDSSLDTSVCEKNVIDDKPVDKSFSLIERQKIESLNIYSNEITDVPKKKTRTPKKSKEKSVKKGKNENNLDLNNEIQTGSALSQLTAFASINPDKIKLNSFDSNVKNLNSTKLSIKDDTLNKIESKVKPALNKNELVNKTINSIPFEPANHNKKSKSNNRTELNQGLQPQKVVHSGLPPQHANLSHHVQLPQHIQNNVSQTHPVHFLNCPQPPSSIHNTLAANTSPSVAHHHSQPRGPNSHQIIANSQQPQQPTTHFSNLPGQHLSPSSHRIHQIPSQPPHPHHSPQGPRIRSQTMPQHLGLSPHLSSLPPQLASQLASQHQQQLASQIASGFGIPGYPHFYDPTFAYFGHHPHHPSYHQMSNPYHHPGFPPQPGQPTQQTPQHPQNTNVLMSRPPAPTSLTQAPVQPHLAPLQPPITASQQHHANSLQSNLKNNNSNVS